MMSVVLLSENDGGNRKKRTLLKAGAIQETLIKKTIMKFPFCQRKRVRLSCLGNGEIRFPSDLKVQPVNIFPDVLVTLGNYCIYISRKYSLCTYALSPLELPHFLLHRKEFPECQPKNILYIKFLRPFPPRTNASKSCQWGETHFRH